MLITLPFGGPGFKPGFERGFSVVRFSEKATTDAMSGLGLKLLAGMWAIPGGLEVPQGAGTNSSWR